MSLIPSNRCLAQKMEIDATRSGRRFPAGSLPSAPVSRPRRGERW